MPVDEIRFRAAVREFLQKYGRKRKPVDNLLLRSALLAQHGISSAAGVAPRQAALLTLIAEHSAAYLAASPTEALHRVLDASYFRPLPGKQTAVAERLGLSFATYRRRLADGEQRLADHLWELELAARRALHRL